MSVAKRELVTTRSPTGYRPQTTSFSLYIRAYWPQAEINDGMWTPPKVAGENLCDLGLMLSVARRSVYRSLRRNKRLRATAQEGFAAVARVRSSLSASCRTAVADRCRRSWLLAHRLLWCPKWRPTAGVVRQIKS
jgi:hypothetical protein